MIHLLRLVAVCAALALPAEAQNLEVHFLNVGQGHAALIVGPDGTTVMVDGGNPGDGSGTIVPYLNSLGITSLTYGITTHFHTDHMGGLDEVYNLVSGPTTAFDRGNFNIPSNTQVTQYLSSVAGVRATPTVGQTVALGGGATLEFVCLNGDWSGGSIDPYAFLQGENGSSIGMVIRYGDFDAFIGGDLSGGGNATSDMETLIRNDVGPVEVALASHHGSNTSSNSVFIATLDPGMVVYSCGPANGFGHPTKTVTNRWNSPGASRVAWSTTEGEQTNGSGGYVVADDHIVITSDGASFQARRGATNNITYFATHEQPGSLPGSGDLVISELLVDPQGAVDSFGEWLELQNVSGSDLNLDGVRIESGGQSFTLSTTVVCRADERVVFGVDGRETRNGNVFLTSGAPWEDFGLSNGSSSVVVRAAGGAAVIDSVPWGGAGVPVTTGVSAERINALGGSGAGNFAPALTAWDGADLGTPGEVNDNAAPPCQTPTPYCFGISNSTGTGGKISFSGSINVLANDLVLEVVDCPAGQPGLFYYGPNAISAPFGDGLRCVGGAVFRLLPVVFTNPSGETSFAIDSNALEAGGEMDAGSSWNFQFWYRDPFVMGGSSFNLTDAINIVFCSETVLVNPGDIVITEFMAKPGFAADPAGEWFEIYNTTDHNLNLSGWTLEDGAGDSHTFGSYIIASGAYAVLGRTDDLGMNGGVSVDYEYGADMTLSDGADQIRLLDPLGTLIDVIDYVDGFFPLATGRSSALMSGVLDHIANDNSTSWCLSLTPIGGGNPDQATPGAANDCP